jgi:hypothetical protein
MRVSGPVINRPANPSQLNSMADMVNIQLFTYHAEMLA